MTGSTSGAQQGHDDHGKEHDGDVSYSAQPIGSSTRAEDLFTTPSALPSNDPVRVETAARLRRCMLERKSPLAWVMQMVLSSTTHPAGGPTERQIGELITSTANIERLS